QELFEAVDVFGPERAVVGDPVDEWLHAARLHTVVNAAPLAPVVDQPGVFERCQALRHRGLRDREACREVFDRGLAPGERLENRPAAGICQRLEDLVFGRSGALHGLFISAYLSIVKRGCFRDLSPARSSGRTVCAFAPAPSRGRTIATRPALVWARGSGPVVAAVWVNDRQKAPFFLSFPSEPRGLPRARPPVRRGSHWRHLQGLEAGLPAPAEGA